MSAEPPSGGDALEADAPAASGWLDRCAARIAELEPDIATVEAADIARTMAAVERLAAMTPEAAVDFVSGQAESGEPTRYERRKVPRSAGAIAGAGGGLEATSAADRR